MLDDLQILRITAAKLDDLHGSVAVPVGVHALNARISLRLQGTVEQQGPQEYTPTANISLLAVLALVGERLGVKARRLYELIVEAAEEAHAKGEPVGEFIEHSKAALATVKAKVVANLPLATRKGPLRRILEISEIDINAATLQATALRRARALCPRTVRHAASRRGPRARRMIKLFRCMNEKCSRDGRFHDFQGDVPKCDWCGIEANHPKFGHLVRRLPHVHFDPPSEVPGIGLNVRACEPSKSIFAGADLLGTPDPFHAGTGVPDAVTCPACKDTQAWKTAHAAIHADTEAGKEALKAGLTRLQTVTTPAAA